MVHVQMLKKVVYFNLLNYVVLSSTINRLWSVMIRVCLTKLVYLQPITHYGLFLFLLVKRLLLSARFNLIHLCPINRQLLRLDRLRSTHPLILSFQYCINQLSRLLARAHRRKCNQPNFTHHRYIQRQLCLWFYLKLPQSQSKFHLRVATTARTQISRPNQHSHTML